MRSGHKNACEGSATGQSVTMYSRDYLQEVPNHPESQPFDNSRCYWDSISFKW